MRVMNDNIKYLNGISSDDASSLVKSYITEDGLWSTSIKTDADNYFVEVFHSLDYRNSVADFQWLEPSLRKHYQTSSNLLQ